MPSAAASKASDGAYQSIFSSTELQCTADFMTAWYRSASAAHEWSRWAVRPSVRRRYSSRDLPASSAEVPAPPPSAASPNSDATLSRKLPPPPPPPPLPSSRAALFRSISASAARSIAFALSSLASSNALRYIAVLSRGVRTPPPPDARPSTSSAIALAHALAPLPPPPPPSPSAPRPVANDVSARDDSNSLRMSNRFLAPSVRPRPRRWARASAHPETRDRRAEAYDRYASSDRRRSSSVAFGARDETASESVSSSSSSSSFSEEEESAA
mmetsp:Transcript_28663/g.84480  ORF Transcript_28663/g.84480 Transcript_28663/m.84480 type:complete len:271 (+) Transcript_28663:573-1385(+)